MIRMPASELRNAGPHCISQIERRASFGDILAMVEERQPQLAKQPVAEQRMSLVGRQRDFHLTSAEWNVEPESLAIAAANALVQCRPVCGDNLKLALADPSVRCAAA